MSSYRTVRMAQPALFVSILLFVCASNASAQFLNEIYGRMDNYGKALVSLRGMVAMVKHDPVINATDRRTGKLVYLERTGKEAAFRIDWTNRPIESFVVIDGRYTVFRPELNQKIEGAAIRSSNTGPANDLLSFMRMSRADLKANFTAVYKNTKRLDNGVDTWHIQLTPKNRVSYKIAEIWVDASGFPAQTSITEHNGSTTTILISDPKTNVSIQLSEFDTPTKGIKIIRG